MHGRLRQQLRWRAANHGRVLSETSPRLSETYCSRRLSQREVLSLTLITFCQLFRRHAEVIGRQHPLIANSGAKNAESLPTPARSNGGRANGSDPAAAPQP